MDREAAIFQNGSYCAGGWTHGFETKALIPVVAIVALDKAVGLHEWTVEPHQGEESPREHR